jgi:hypothetical protein
MDPTCACTKRPCTTSAASTLAAATPATPSVTVTPGMNTGACLTTCPVGV